MKEIIREVVIINNEYPKNQFNILLDILTLDRIYDLNYLGHALEVAWDILCELNEE
jgi:hypothetical protein